jgi:hypothetical protein
VRDARFQARREAFHLGSPVRQKRSGRDQQARLPITIGPAMEHEQQRQYLDGLAESHVVGKTGPEAQLREEIEPLTPTCW